MNNMSNHSLLLPKCFVIFGPHIISEENNIALTVVYALIIPFTIISNILLITGVIKTKKNTLTPTQKLFILLSVCDLTVGVIQLPLQIYFLRISGDISCTQTALRAFWSVFPICLSGTNIFLISVDRYILMVHNRWYKTYFTTKVLIACIVTEIIICTLWAVWYLLLSLQTNTKKFSVLFICLAVYEAFVLCTAVFLNIALLNNVQAATRASSVKHKKDLKLSHTIMLIAVTLLLSYTPSVCSLLVTAFFYLYSTNQSSLRSIAIMLIWTLVPPAINAGLNASIYILRNQRIKKLFKIKLFTIDEGEDSL